MRLPISDITPFTLLDYPDHTACILWFAGCNFRCSYCHNPELIEGHKPKLAMQAMWSFLHSRAGLLDGVVFSGGECTLSPYIVDFAEDVRSMGFKLKIDTNGSKPRILKQLIENESVDYIALDYKAPLHRYHELTHWSFTQDFETSLDLLIHSGIDSEIRTTVHTGLLSEDDIQAIVHDLDKRGFTGRFFIQNFRAGVTLIPLPKQPRLLNTAQFTSIKNFQCETRNF